MATNNYTAARTAYLEWYGHVITPQVVDPDDVVRSGSSTGELALTRLAERVDGFALASEELTEATRQYLTASNDSQRMEAVDSLLHQIEGDMAIANLLWDVVDRASEENAQQDIVRSTIQQPTKSTMRRLMSEMPISLDGESQPTDVVRSATISSPKDIDSALENLRFEIEDTIDLVYERTLNIGSRLTRDILSLGHGQWPLILQAVDLLQGNEKAGNVGWGLEDEVKAVTAEVASGLRSVLINVVEKILIIIEKNDIIRYTMTDWLEELQNTDSPNRKLKLTSLLQQLYQTESFRRHDLDVWLQDAQEIDKIQYVTDAVIALGDNYDKLANQVRRLSGLIGVGSLFLNPVLLSVGLALQIGLLGTLIFAGYDHLDEGQRTLNITRGVKELLIQELPISRKTIERAENLRLKTVR